jgi:hypothetical protein
VRLGRRISGGTGASGAGPGAESGDSRLCLLDGLGKLVAVARPRPDGTLEMLRVFRA